MKKQGNTIATIIERLKRSPSEVIKTRIGSGTSSSRIEGTNTYKPVVCKDTYAQALMQLDYLLFDLGIDVGLSPEELEKGLPTRNR